jgi:tetratricopeptide (TPR) repeat protein
MIQRTLTTALLVGTLSGCGASPKTTLESSESPVNTTAQQPGQTTGTQGQSPIPIPDVVKRLTIEDRAALLADGRSAVEGGDLATAMDLLKKVILDSSGDPAETKIITEARYNLGVISEWQGQYDDAKRHYEAALNREPQLGIAVVAIGRLLLRGGDAATALNYARGRLVGRTKSIPLRNALNRLRLATGQEVNRIEADSKQVLREDEKNVEAMINLSAAYHRVGKYELAAAILENAKAIDGENPEILWRMGEAQLRLGEKIRARMTFEEATQLPFGATAEIYNNLGLIYHEAGDFGGAELQFRKALARWPDMLESQINLGNSLKGQQRYQEALECLQAAQSKWPTSAVITYNLGILLLDGQFEGLSGIERLERSVSYFEEYKRHRQTVVKDDPVDSYIAEAKKRLVVEQKRAAQLRRVPKSAPAPVAADASPEEDPEKNSEREPVPASSDGSTDDQVTPVAPEDGQ